MAAKGPRGLNEAMRSLSLGSHTTRQTVASKIISKATFTRSMATEAPLPNTTTSSDLTRSVYKPTLTVPVTIFGFPSYEPQRLESWSAKHLYLPLRRDILHQAVVYEGDNTRSGTASSKTRWDVAGSHRKLRPQKGMGMARVGSRQSPIRRGGGKSFGPQPRDFGTHMTRKAYDMAWRTALSYRYRRGELIVCENGVELPMPEAFGLLRSEAKRHQMSTKTIRELTGSFRVKWAQQVFNNNEWGRASGRSTVITTTRRKELFDCLDLAPLCGRALEVADVDVKDLLETGRLVVERDALMQIIEEHQSDLTANLTVVHPGLPKHLQSGSVLVA
ncbi:ribosomal protein L4/L1 family protein [Xylariaceae sp. FL0255]|nr:ribosomal protein L4/L1 family protein [Xylariaceae sp. FL0255]